MSKYTAEQVQKIRAAHYEYMREYNAKPDAAILSVLDEYAAHLRERESAKAQVFVPPSNCRQRLKREGRPYPRSSCQACGKWCPRNQDCETLLDASAINPIFASARVPDAHDIAQKVREALDREACPDAWMTRAYEAAVNALAATKPEKE